MGDKHTKMDVSTLVTERRMIGKNVFLMAGTDPIRIPYFFSDLTCRLNLGFFDKRDVRQWYCSQQCSCTEDAVQFTKIMMNKISAASIGKNMYCSAGTIAPNRIAPKMESTWRAPSA